MFVVAYSVSILELTNQFWSASKMTLITLITIIARQIGLSHSNDFIKKMVNNCGSEWSKKWVCTPRRGCVGGALRRTCPRLGGPLVMPFCNKFTERWMGGELRVSNDDDVQIGGTSKLIRTSNLMKHVRVGESVIVSPSETWLMRDS